MAKKKKKPAQDRHAAAITITSPLTLTKADVKFVVERDGERLGTLYVSRGAVAWKPSNGKKNYKFAWPRFDQVMQSGLRTDGK